MKNTIKLFGIIALVAVLGFTMVACKDEEETKITVEDTVGKITITGIPDAHKAKNFVAGGYDEFGQLAYMAGTNVSEDGLITYAKVSNTDQIVLKVWKVNKDLTEFTNFNGNVTGVIFAIITHEDKDPVGYTKVSFTTGVGTGAYAATLAAAQAQ